MEMYTEMLEIMRDQSSAATADTTPNTKSVALDPSIDATTVAEHKDASATATRDATVSVEQPPAQKQLLALHGSKVRLVAESPSLTQSSTLAAEELHHCPDSQELALSDALFERIMARRHGCLAPEKYDSKASYLRGADLERAIVLDAESEPCVYAARDIGVSPTAEFDVFCLQAGLGDAYAMNNLALFFCMANGQVGFPAPLDTVLAAELFMRAIALGSTVAANNHALLLTAATKGKQTASKSLLGLLRKQQSTCLAARHNLATLTRDRRGLARLASLYPPSAFVAWSLDIASSAKAQSVSFEDWRVVSYAVGALGVHSGEASLCARGRALLSVHKWAAPSIVFQTELNIAPGFKVATFSAAFGAWKLANNERADEKSEECCSIRWRHLACRLKTESWCERALSGGCVDFEWLLAAARAYATLRLRRTAQLCLETVLREIARRSRIHAILLADYLSSIACEEEAFRLYLHVAGADSTAATEFTTLGGSTQAQCDYCAILVALRATRLPVFAMRENASRSDLDCLCVECFVSAGPRPLNPGAFALVAQRMPSAVDDCSLIESAPTFANIYLGDCTLVLKTRNLLDDDEEDHETKPTTAFAALLPKLSERVQTWCDMGSVILPLNRLPRFFIAPPCDVYPRKTCDLCRIASRVNVSGNAAKVAHGEHAAWSGAYWTGYPADSVYEGQSYLRAEACVVRAMVAVARRLGNGVGVRGDPVDALNWWRRAADAGSADAQFELGLAYLEGRRGVRKQGAKAAAAKWLEVSARQGHENAKLALAELNSSSSAKSSETVGDSKSSTTSVTSLKACSSAVGRFLGRSPASALDSALRLISQTGIDGVADLARQIVVGTDDPAATAFNATAADALRIMDKAFLPAPR